MKNSFLKGLPIIAFLMFSIGMSQNASADCWDCDNVSSPSYCSYNLWFGYVCSSKFESPTRICNIACSNSGCDSEECQSLSPE